MTDPPPGEGHRRRARAAAGPLATVGLTLLGAILSLELWKANLGVPLRYTQVDDSKFYFMLIKGIIDHGWYQTNANLGAPFGTQLYDFPQGADNLNFLLIKGLSLVTSSWALVTNLFFLATFPLTGLAAYYALRRLDVSPAAGCVCSVLFSLLPYHFYRQESQLLLSAYYSVPLTCYLFIALVSGRPLFAGAVATRRRALRLVSGRSVITVVTCVVIGSAGLYYAGFAVVLLLAATLVAVVGGRGRRALGSGAFVCLVVGATLAINLAPSILYGLEHGANTAIVRTPIESEQLGLRLSNLLLPVQGDRIPGLTKVSGNYAAQTSPGYCESCNAGLGVVGAGGFIVLCVVGLTALVGAAGVAGARRAAWQARLGPAAIGALVTFGIATTGGISALIAYFVTPDLRGWNRLSLFIAFFSFLAVGMLLDGARRRLGSRAGAGGDARKPRAAGRRLGRRAPAGGGTRAPRVAGRRPAVGWAVLLVVVLGLGAVEETSNFYLVSYSAAARSYHSDQAFGRLIEARMPRGSSIFELPYIPFPEGYHVAGVPTTATTGFDSSYELLRPYLNTTGLDFSFAAVKGRPSDWESALSAKPLNLAVAGAAAAGFSGIYVDPRGYGTQAARVAEWLRQLVGTAPLVSGLADAWFLDLRPYTASLDASASPAAITALRQATLHPLEATCGPNPAVLELTNPGSAPARAAFSATLENGVPGRMPVEITFPGGTTEERTVDATEPTMLERRLVVPPGTSTVTFRTIATPAVKAGPAMSVVVSGASLTDSAFAPFRSFRAIRGRTPPLTGVLAPSCAIQYEATVPPL